jgi:hypothetical protein
MSTNITRQQEAAPRIKSFALGCLLALVAAAPVTGQTQGFTAERKVQQDAAGIEAQARVLQEQPKQYRRAAELYMQASDLRTPAEPERIADRKMAARLFFYSGNTARARVVMEQAADWALAAGDILQAAHTYLDASVLARDSRASGEANRLAGKAELLTQSPVIAESARQEVLARIVRK